MEVQEIEVFIEKDGRVRLEVHGAQGLSCLELTKALEQALGGEIEARQMRPEAYEQNPQAIDEDLHLKSGQGE